MDRLIGPKGFHKGQGEGEEARHPSYIPERLLIVWSARLYAGDGTPIAPRTGVKLFLIVLTPIYQNNSAECAVGQ